MISSKTIVDRYLSRKAAISEDKLKEIMLKIRKGATSSLTWKQLQEVLAVLDPGWKFEKFVGLVKAYYDDLERASTISLHPQQLAELEARHNKIKNFAVTSLPSTPRHGQVYILDLTPIETVKNYANQEYYLFSFKPWVGNEGWRIVTPDGKTHEALPSRHDVFRGPSNAVGRDSYWFESWKAGHLSLSDTVRWLKEETDWLDQINKKLNMEAFQPSAIRTRESTGSCPVCFQNIKARPHIVFHGYKRPGGGTTFGSCFGVDFLPFEISVEGTKKYLEKVITPQYETSTKLLQRLKSRAVKSLTVQRGKKEITPADPEWERTLASVIDNTEREIKMLKRTLEDYKNLVQHWKERPLPKEGEPVIDWYHQGQKS